MSNIKDYEGKLCLWTHPDDSDLQEFLFILKVKKKTYNMLSVKFVDPNDTLLLEWEPYIDAFFRDITIIG